MTCQGNQQGVTFGRVTHTRPFNTRSRRLCVPERPYSDGVIGMFGDISQRGWRARWNTVAVIAVAVAATTMSVFTAAANPALGYLPDPAAGIVVAAVAGLVLLVRRRLPLMVLFVTAGAFAADTVVVPLAIAVYTVSVQVQVQVQVQVHEQAWWRRGVGITAAVVAIVVSAGPAGSLSSRMVGVLLVVAGPMLAGLYVSARRNLIAGLQERAIAAERETHLAAENARLAERARIARDMHDVLGHKVTIISVQAAALEVMPAAADPIVQERVQIIADTARTALGEVRQILGLLDPHTARPAIHPTTPRIVHTGTEAASTTDDSPQRGASTIEHLVEDANRLGITVSYSANTAEVLPANTAAVIYRIVQEGLTNAAKHVPGAHVAITLHTNEGISVRITSTAAASSTFVTSGTPAISGTADISSGLGSGYGLGNLRARVYEAGGRFTGEPTEDGGFQLEAWLPAELR
jgi:signal transduction histidine kinase